MDRLRRRPLLMLPSLVLPPASFLLLGVIFSSSVPRDLPVACVDLDGSGLSRELTRSVDATSGLRVVHSASDPEAARELVLRGDVYGFLVIPEHYERDVLRAQSPPVIGYHNAALLLPGSVVRRDLRQAVGAASRERELLARQRRGQPEAVALAQREPVRLEWHTISNPALSYAAFLLPALFPTMLQIFVLMATVQAVGAELKEGTASEWLATAGGSLWPALVGKLAPYLASFLAVAVFMHALLFRALAVPLRGSGLVLGLGTVLFVLAYLALGVLIVAWTANLRFAASAAAFYSGPAFAFVGVTFPTIGMPALARAWGLLLPLSHYLRLVTEQSVRGTPLGGSVPELVTLAAFVVAAPLLAWRRLGLVLRDPSFWGRC